MSLTFQLALTVVQGPGEHLICCEFKPIIIFSICVPPPHVPLLFDDARVSPNAIPVERVKVGYGPTADDKPQMLDGLESTTSGVPV